MKRDASSKQSGFHVYGLTDPRSGHIRYIGKVNGYPNSRMRSHIYEARYGKRHNHRLAWIRKLLKDGFQPRFILLETCVDDKELIIAERRWIATFRALGAQLVNGTDGGEGMANPSAETRAKLTASRKGKKANLRPGVRAMRSVAMKNRWEDPEFREKVAAGNARRRGVPTGRSISPELRQKMTEGFRRNPSMKGKRNPNAIRAMNAATRGVPKTPEHRAKLAEATRRYYAEHGPWNQRKKGVAQ